MRLWLAQDDVISVQSDKTATSACSDRKLAIRSGESRHKKSIKVLKFCFITSDSQCIFINSLGPKNSVICRKSTTLSLEFEDGSAGQGEDEGEAGEQGATGISGESEGHTWISQGFQRHKYCSFSYPHSVTLRTGASSVILKARLSCLNARIRLK